MLVHCPHNRERGSLLLARVGIVRWLVLARTLARVGSSWDDEDQQENAFFEKSVKVETHQAVVKVLEHGNTQMLVLEVSN